MPNFNLPDKNDPNYQDKVVSLLEELFGTTEAPIKNFKPIPTPEEGTQIGSVWYDESDGKLRVMTSNGTKIVQYE